MNYDELHFRYFKFECCSLILWIKYSHTTVILFGIVNIFLTFPALICFLPSLCPESWLMSVPGPLYRDLDSVPLWHMHCLWLGYLHWLYYAPETGLQAEIVWVSYICHRSSSLQQTVSIEVETISGKAVESFLLSLLREYSAMAVKWLSPLPSCLSKAKYTSCSLAPEWDSKIS